MLQIDCLSSQPGPFFVLRSSAPELGKDKVQSKQSEGWDFFLSKKEKASDLAMEKKHPDSRYWKPHFGL